MIRQAFEMLRELAGRFWYGEIDLAQCVQCRQKFNFDDYEDETECVEVLIAHSENECVGKEFRLNFQRFFGLYKEELRLVPSPDEMLE